MSDLILSNGITVTSSVFYLRTGEIKPFEPSMRKDVIRSVISQMSAQEIEALPPAPPGSEPEFDVEIHPDGSTVVRDL